ncbi:hypothetical protein KPL76_01910 [Subtercola sp. PAMC28395]|uniref:hypothetical protein n=1 Tax=Subtercola sp. PAMC28395 TaxID=2846775 RepID=UPI001C0BBCFD|nr:hypothetical protein [Subtercola sp. PAMC28395]QWT24207.1 hypothetical protein KPL76_01910 [Subtercola sp. PAMC28395]
MRLRLFWVRELWGPLACLWLILLSALTENGAVLILSVMTLAVWASNSFVVRTLWDTRLDVVKDRDAQILLRKVLIGWRFIVDKAGLVPGGAATHFRAFPAVENYRVEAVGIVLRVRLLKGQTISEWQAAANRIASHAFVNVPVTVTAAPAQMSRVEIHFVLRDLLGESRGR